MQHEEWPTLEQIRDGLRADGGDVDCFDAALVISDVSVMRPSHEVILAQLVRLIFGIRSTEGWMSAEQWYRLAAELTLVVMEFQHVAMKAGVLSAEEAEAEWEWIRTGYRKRGPRPRAAELLVEGGKQNGRRELALTPAWFEPQRHRGAGRLLNPHAGRVR